MFWNDLTREGAFSLFQSTLTNGVFVEAGETPIAVTDAGPFHLSLTLGRPASDIVLIRVSTAHVFKKTPKLKNPRCVLKTPIFFKKSKKKTNTCLSF